MAPVVNVAVGSPVHRQIVYPVLSHKPINSERAITGSNRCVAAGRIRVWSDREGRLRFLGFR
jgi:hypothetical protein